MDLHKELQEQADRLMVAAGEAGIHLMLLAERRVVERQENMMPGEADEMLRDAARLLDAADEMLRDAARLLDAADEMLRNAARLRDAADEMVRDAAELLDADTA